jgi:hypothetical protein
MLSECALPTAQDLTNMGAYTAYQAGMIQNDPSVTTSLIAQDAAQSADLISGNTDCAYNAAQNSPALSQIFGPTLTCALTDPTSPMFWMLYAAIGLVAWKVIAK